MANEAGGIISLILQDEGVVTFRGSAGSTLCGWSGSTGCGIAAGSCCRGIRGEAGTQPLMAFLTKALWSHLAPHGEQVGSAERCRPIRRSTSPSPEATRATPSAQPSTTC